MTDWTEDGESRSAHKRDAEALQALGERLITLPPERLAQVPLPENLADAVALARRIKDHSAMRRQRQYIGKLMRHVDPEAIRSALARFDAEDTGRTQAHHAAERWRERLIADGEPALTAFAAEHPNVDPAHLRRLVGEVQREQREGRPPSAFRALFRWLRDAIGNS